MTRILAAFSLLLPLVSLSGCGCDTPVSPSDVTVRGDVYRHSSGGGIQVCLLHRGRPVSGAEVSVNGRRLHESMHGMYLITLTSMPIESGVTYELTVRLEHGSFSGTTVLCDSFYCLRPEQSYEHTVGEPLVAEWTSTGDNYRYVVLIEQNLFEKIRQTYVSPILQDTIHAIPAGAFDKSGYYSIMIFSFENGVSYHPFDAVAIERENLTNGALGFFGSWRQAETRIWVGQPG